MPDTHAPNKVDLTVWLADLTYTQQTVAADVMPNAVGGIATFTETQVDLKAPIRLFKYPEKLVSALEADGAPDVIGFSNYIWNRSLSYAFAEAIKARFPKTVVIFGGPNYPVDPDEQVAFLSSLPAVDFYVIKEGELAYARLVEQVAATGGDVEAIKQMLISSVHTIGADGTPYMAPTTERIRDLTEIPSPYATGRLDEFFDGVLLPIVQTNRGCPFSCTFCVEGVSYYNKVYKNSGAKVAEELDYIGAKMAEMRDKGGRNDLFIADSNFGMYADDLNTCRELARTQEVYQWPEYINVATGKNKKERVLEAAKLINGALRLSGSVQSLDEGVLENIKRANISADSLLELALEAGEVGANSYSEIILGLPGDSKSAHHRTVQLIMDAGFTNIYLFQLMLLPGTDMSTPETRNKFAMDTKYRVLPRCYGNYELFGENLIAAEIEEICVANATLSFEDYLECRRFHLLATIFYNDGIFGTLLELLRRFDLSVYRWMELLVEAPVDGGLKNLFDAFNLATRDELWDVHEDLEAFVHEDGVIEKYLDGRLGNNLLFVHKTLAITQHASQLAALARQTILQCLSEAGRDDDETVTFIDDALRYHVLRMTNIFEKRDENPSAVLEYDVMAFENDPSRDEITDYRLEGPVAIDFALDDTQHELIERYLGIYGDSIVGIGRILSKVHVRKLFRHPVTDQKVLTGESELRFQISGLQN